MKLPTLFLSFALAATTVASHIIRRQDNGTPESFRGPNAWEFHLVNWSGAGCPDFNWTDQEREARGYYPRHDSVWDPPFWNTSSTTFWWYVQLPWMQATLLANETSRLSRITCDMEISYEEVQDYNGGRIPDDKTKWHLRLHDNASTIMANYKLDEGVTAEWQVRYYLPGDPTVAAQDFVSIDGPLEAGEERGTKGPGRLTEMRFDWMPPLYTDDSLELPKCGRGNFRIRIDLWLAARKPGVGGKVTSRKVKWSEGNDGLWDGAGLGYSFDWERCEGR